MAEDPILNIFDFSDNLRSLEKVKSIFSGLSKEAASVNKSLRTEGLAEGTGSISKALTRLSALVKKRAGSDEGGVGPGVRATYDVRKGFGALIDPTQGLINELSDSEIVDSKIRNDLLIQTYRAYVAEREKVLKEEHDEIIRFNKEFEAERLADKKKADAEYADWLKEDAAEYAGIEKFNAAEEKQRLKEEHDEIIRFNKEFEAERLADKKKAAAAEKLLFKEAEADKKAQFEAEMFLSNLRSKELKEQALRRSIDKKFWDNEDKLADKEKIRITKEALAEQKLADKEKLKQAEAVAKEFVNQATVQKKSVAA